MRIMEVKRHLDGRIERFICDVVELHPDRAILSYLWHRDELLRDGPIHLPAGEILTLAFYWQGRNYLIYKLMAPNGRLFGHRFDICDDVHITRDSISWLDLALDLWVDPAGGIHVLDEEEVEAYKVQGLLTGPQLKIIQETKSHLLLNYREILAEVA